MEIYRLQMEITNIQNLISSRENQLKMVGIDLSQLSDNSATSLNKYAELKLKAKLYDLSKTCLEEFAYKRMKEHIENKLFKFELTRDICNLETKLQEEIAQQEEMNRTVADDKRRVAERNIDREISLIQKDINTLQKELQHITSANSFNLDEIITKVENIELKK